MGVIEDFILLRIQATNDAKETIEKVTKGFETMANLVGTVGSESEKTGTKTDSAFTKMQESVDAMTGAVDKLITAIDRVGTQAVAADEKVKILGADSKTVLSEVAMTGGAEGGGAKGKALGAGAAGNVAALGGGLAGGEVAATESAPKPKEGGGGGGGMGGVGMGMAVAGGTAAFAGIEVMKKGVEAASAWDDELRTLANSAGLPLDNVKKLGDNFLNMGNQGSIGADELVTSFGKVAGELTDTYGPSALTVANSTAYMTAAEQLALASHSSLDTSTKGLTDTLRAFHLGMGDATNASNDLYNISRLTGQPLQAIEQRMTMLQPRIAGAGMDLDHFTGYLNEMTKQVGSGRSANMMLASSIQAISDAKPGSGAGKELELLGFHLDPTKPQNFQAALGFLHDKFAQMKDVPTQSAETIKKYQDALNSANQTQATAASHLADLEEKAKTSGGEQGALKQQIEAAKSALEHANAAVDAHGQALAKASGKNSEYQALQAMFGKNAAVMQGVVDGGTKALEDNTKQVTSSADAKTAAETSEQSYAAQQAELGNNLHGLAITIGQAVVPALSAIMKAVMPVIQAISHWAQEHPKLMAAILIGVTVFGALIAIVGVVMMVMGPLMVIIGGVGAAIAFLVSPIGLAILAVAAIIAIIVLIITHFQKFKDILGEIGNFIKNVFVDAFNAVWGQIKSWWGDIENFFGGLGHRIGSILSGMGGAIWGGISGAFNWVWGEITGWVGDLVSFFGGIPGAIGSALSGLGSMIGGAFRDALNWAFSGVNDFLRAIGDFGWDGISVLGHGIPGFHVRDLFGGKMWQIPKLDTGGYITETGFAVVHKGEAVNTAAEVSRGVSGGGGGGGTVEHHFDLRGAVIADDRSLDALIKKMGYRLATHTMPTSGFRNVR